MQKKTTLRDFELLLSDSFYVEMRNTSGEKVSAFSMKRVPGKSKKAAGSVKKSSSGTERLNKNAISGSFICCEGILKAVYGANKVSTGNVKRRPDCTNNLQKNAKMR